MRTAKLTMDEMARAEEAAAARRDGRNNGFKLMRDRDLGQHVLSNGVAMIWHVPRPEPAPKVSYTIEGEETELFVYPPGCRIPKDSFILVVEGKEIIFNTEEFRRWLRWA